MAFRSTDLMIDVDVRVVAAKRKPPKRGRKQCQKACSKTHQLSSCKAGTNTKVWQCAKSGTTDSQDLALLLGDLKRLLSEAGNAA
jgi:hypothetical protein